ncbi:MAG: B12-binding domain-containing radical SAM protein [Oscillospiraceae bacterium]|nr:B12-binding domain-containing radical SAM protein [Oscillospiraceae bacterium]
MSKVTLLAINAKYVHSSLAVWLLSAGISQNSRLSHDVSIVEATIKQNNNEIIEKIVENKPQVVGISTYIWNVGKLQQLMVSLKEALPAVVIVLGGPEASYNAEHWIGQGADHVICGEGEESLPMLLDALEEKIAAPRIIKASLLNQRPINPYNDEYMNALGARIAYIETSRGCPFRCAFCLSGESSVKYFPLELAKEQLDKLSKSGTKTIKFVDRTFNCDGKRAYELFEYVIAMDTDCCFHFEVAADLFDEESLKLLGTAIAGRIQLEAGLQSYFEAALLASSRKTDLIKAEKNIRKLLEYGNIHIHVDLIAGLPYEDFNEFQNSFNRAYALGAHTLQLGFLKLLHGSVLREQAEDLGISFIKEPPYEIVSSPWLSSEELSMLKIAENALQRTYNKGRFLKTLSYVLEVTRLSPFELYRILGEYVQNHGMPLDMYAGKIYDCLKALPAVKPDLLKDSMIFDWLGMVKGRNMPAFLKIRDKRHKEAVQLATSRLGRNIHKDEAAVLISGDMIYVDATLRNPVTGLYEIGVI